MTASTRRMRVLSALVGIGMLAGVAPGTAGASTEAQSEPRIKIGISIATSPTFGFVGRLPGIEAAVRGINESGGINGQKVDLVQCDTTNANDGEACSRRMVEEQVVATVNQANFFADDADVRTLSDAGIAMIDPFSTAASESDNGFFLDGGIGAEYAGIPQWMKLEKLKTIQYLAGQTSSSDNTIGIIDPAAEFYGRKVLGRTDIPLAAADASPYVSDAASAGADVNITVLAPFQTSVFLQAGQQLGQKIRIAGPEGQLTQDQYEEFGQSGGILEGAMFIGATPPLSAKKQFPELRHFLRDLAAERKAGNDDAEIGKIAGQAIRGWLAVQAFAKVAETIEGDVTAESFMEAINTVKDVELGLIPPWTPSAAGPDRFPRASNPFSWLITVEDGKAVLARKKPINTLVPFE